MSFRVLTLRLLEGASNYSFFTLKSRFEAWSSYVSYSKK
jgi:hypothetical protein